MKSFAVEEGACRHLDAHDPSLQLEFLDAMGQRRLVVAKHLKNVVAVFLFADKQQAFEVLSLTAGLDDIASRIGLDKLDRIIERGEILLRRPPPACRLCADDRRASPAPARVEHDEIGPVNLSLPVVGLGNKPVRNFLLVRIVDVELYVVPFLHHRPGDVGNQTVQRNKEILHGPERLS
jgi:hypothetical protein